jgi:hypothetical protein
VELIDPQADLAREAGIFQSAEDRAQPRLIREPDAVGDDLVEAEAKLRCPARQSDQEFRIEERLAAGETEQLDAVGMGVLEKAERGRDVEPIGPFDRDAAMGAGEVALIRPGEGDVIGAKGARAAFHGAAGIAFGKRHGDIMPHPDEKGPLVFV